MTAARAFQFLLALAGLLVAGACTTVGPERGVLKESLSERSFDEKNYELRTWVPNKELDFDPVRTGQDIRVPINYTWAKIIGPEYEESVRSLATKLWLIENARYTADAVYYIFKRDTVGYAVLGALCNAVQRGVDVRLMVDSAGSFHTTHSELDALLTCADEAGDMLDASGQPTGRKARVQVIIINALSKVFVRMNRRSHDKLLVVDGHAVDRAVVMTGGRNISSSYYGIKDDGSPDPDAYQDLEILLRPAPQAGQEPVTVGDASVFYFSLLSLGSGNKFLRAPSPGSGNRGRYASERKKAQDALAFLKNHPTIRKDMEAMPSFLDEGFSLTGVRMAHELGNLTDTHSVKKAVENREGNPNSIRGRLAGGLQATEPKLIRIVSPYLFLAEYTQSSDGTQHDDVQFLRELLEKHPDSMLEVVTNSAVTSDNPLAQAVIDMDTAPRLLLTKEMRDKWTEGQRSTEPPRELVESEEWRRLVANPRVRVYEMGKLDAVELGGTETYGKLHAKFISADGAGFIGTDNFDYRSRLFNNEFGFFFRSDELYQRLSEIFDQLAGRSLPWGSPEWLEQRRQILQMSGMKGTTTRYQRFIYKFSKATGLHWLY
jgi:phosphatidylserine/phosphatidylglycerophosphate/cardiolipin synthase-like enzyme